MKPPYTQTHTGTRRDQAARFAYGELERDEQLELMNAGQSILELRNMGELGLAELLYALVDGGWLDDCNGSEDNDESDAD